MNEELKRKLSEYVDGALPPDERAAVESALASDPEARRELESLKALSASLKALPREKLPQGFNVRLDLKRAAPAQRDYWVLPPQLRPVAGALSFAVVAMVVWDRTRPVVPPTYDGGGWVGDDAKVVREGEAPATQLELASEIDAVAKREATGQDGEEALEKGSAGAAARRSRGRAPGAPLEPGGALSAFSGAAALEDKKADSLAKVAAPPAPAPAAEEPAPAAAPAGKGFGSKEADSFSARTEEERSAMNERLYEGLEKQKKSMGIARVIERDEEYVQEEAVAGLRSQLARRADANNPLRVPESAGSAAAGRDARAKSKSGRALSRANVPVPAAPGAFGGGAAAKPAAGVRALRLTSAESLETAWAAAGLPGAPPPMKFGSTHAVFLTGPEGCGIVSVRSGGDRVVVVYRDSGFDDPAARVRALPRSRLPLVLKPAP